MKTKNIISIALITLLILAIPLVAMQFNADVDWGLSDFIIIGTLLFTTGMIYELITKRLRTTAQRMIAATFLLAALLLIWAELAVGILGSPFAGS